MREALRKFDRAWVGVGPDGEEAELLRLASGCGREFLAPVARLHDEEACQAIEVATSLVVPDVGPLSAHHDRHVTLA